ncbi:MAG TPA: serine/threonine-protein kinase [Kofleriaceae bacterium]|nr:serine/threonine-protein kinase [Kofleriaceae bacterium]
MPHDGTDPALLRTPAPDTDGTEMLGMVVDGRYRLDSTLGRGGMGLVFRATHLGLRRQVAVKILHPSLAASPEVRSRFEREALAVGKVDHPNCVATYDVGRLRDGSLYLAMELLEGKSLADILEHEGQLATGRALHILAHVLRGLGGIHAAGLIHRDIKPENIFLVTQGADMDFAKILDFGIAKPMKGELSDDGVKLTQAGMAFGTPIYMAPEQALGNPMDGRSDLYAAAVIGYEMLCGQPPFYSEDKLEVMSMHTAKPVPPMRNRLIRGGKPVASSIEKLILRGLTKKPGDRYPNAEAFLAAVESALATTEGGQTSVDIERVSIRDTGSQPLVSDDGKIDLEDNSYAITDAIEEALGVAPTKPQPRSTPSAGSKQQKKAQRDGEERIQTKVGVPPPADPSPPLVAGGQPLGRARAAGGVGIGLPYTGPQGEPIFGLTPEQRLAQATNARKKYFVYGGVLAVAIVIGVVIAVVTSHKKPTRDHNTPAGQAEEMMDRGDFNGAISLLESKKDVILNDADAQVVLGNAYAARGDQKGALGAYRLALTIDSKKEKDRDLRAALRAMAADKDPEIVKNAFDIWVGETKDPAAQDALFKAATAQSIERRHAALVVLDHLKLGDAKIRIQSYSLDLQTASTCPDRAEAVGKLRAIGDPAAIPALELAVARKITSGRDRGKPFNGCLIDDAKSAIGYLSGLKK